MCSLHDEQPNARIADVTVTRATLAPQDLMTLDAIARQFAVQGRAYWSGVVQRALEALRPAISRPQQAAIDIVAAHCARASDTFGGSYVGLDRDSVDDRPPCDTEPA